MGRIGIGALVRLENVVADLFEAHGHERQMRRGESGYFNEMTGTWVSDRVWEKFWSERPRWEMCVYMVAGNGQVSFAEVADMTPEEAEKLYCSEEFEPEYVYWTSGE